eukprot:Protomagalhaensia_wolfi_Nauph_80__5142@NODE_54_length_4157_cov_100_817387_g45_i0_p1_GENE_NODE_54_length_4157_cov_100_817387_g45_i0NODE_54_length_4157_cov_100_817387_g45_i0_p1_ORF_typecomplete_len553_score111_55Hamartin/PF04388_12/0_13_NODE_54_length_4157_cov_100_817387_g45_i024244082
MLRGLGTRCLSEHKTGMRTVTLVALATAQPCSIPEVENSEKHDVEINTEEVASPNAAQRVSTPATIQPASADPANTALTTTEPITAEATKDTFIEAIPAEVPQRGTNATPQGSTDQSELELTQTQTDESAQSPQESTTTEPNLSDMNLDELETHHVLKYKEKLGREMAAGEEAAYRQLVRTQLLKAMSDKAKEAEEQRMAQQKREEFKLRQEAIFSRVFGRSRDMENVMQLNDPREMLMQPLQSFKQLNDAKKLGLLPGYDLSQVKQILINSQDSKTAQKLLSRYRTEVAGLLKKDESSVTKYELNMIALWYMAAQEYHLAKMKKERRLLEGIERWLSFKSYILRIMEETDTVYTPQGRVDPAWLRRDWGVIHLKSVGELAVPQRYAARASEFQDAWAHYKFNRLHPWEQRGENYMYQGNEKAMNTLNRIIGVLQQILKKSIEARRPSDDDFDYAFFLESEKPFSGVQFTCGAGASTKFDVSRKTACILNDVFPAYRIRPMVSRGEAMHWLIMEGCRRGLGSFNPNDAGQLLDQVVNDQPTESLKQQQFYTA